MSETQYCCARIFVKSTRKERSFMDFSFFARLENGVKPPAWAGRRRSAIFDKGGFNPLFTERRAEAAPPSRMAKCCAALPAIQHAAVRSDLFLSFGRFIGKGKAEADGKMMQLQRILPYPFHAVIQPQTHSRAPFEACAAGNGIPFCPYIDFRAAAEPCAFVAAAVLLFVPFFRSARTMVQQHQLRPPIYLHHVIAATGKQLPQLFLIQLGGRPSVGLTFRTA